MIKRIWQQALSLAALATSTMAVADYMARQLSATRPPTGHGYSFTPWELGVSYEEVSIQTSDGLKLAGWWLGQSAPSRVIIGCTGHRGTKEGMLGIGSGLWRAGNAVLLFDFRSRGASDIAPMSLAHREQEDLLAAVAFVQTRLPGIPIGVIGYSMGAAVALLAAARSEAIQAVVADSPFATMREVVADAYAYYYLPQRPLLDLTDFLTRWRYGYPFNAVRPLDAIAQLAPRPLLLIHCTGDRLIQVKHAHQLFAAANEPKELWIIPEADHCGGYFVDRPAYVQRVIEFFEHSLPACTQQHPKSSSLMLADN